MGIDELLQDPAFQELAKVLAENVQPAVAWFGAGFSIPAGLPDWVRLRTSLTNTAQQKSQSYDDATRQSAIKSLDIIRNIEDPWVAFEKLYDEMGRESFRAEIRHRLDGGTSRQIEHYKLLLKIRWRGILSLNLDNLCQAEIDRQGSRWHTFPGLRAAKMTHLLGSPHPFICHLHGTVDDYETWILRKSDLRSLLRDEGYRAFIQSVLIGHTIVFMGMSADDVAAGGFLRSLERIGVNTRTHYWITSRRDRETDKWAESNHIRVIRYNPANNHSQLVEILKHLGTYKSYDTPQATISSPSNEVITLPSPDQLISETPDSIRKCLNTYVSSTSDPTALTSFGNKYRRCIHQAWLVELTPPDNVFFDLKLDSSLGEGAFGNVYGASDADRQLAVKIIHSDVFRNTDMLNSFRRGVRSLRFLTDAKLPGIVELVDSFEMPPSLVMEYVPGLTLKEAIEHGHIRDWPTRLAVGKQIATIIRSAHESPQRVLHRDIRPHNVILKNYYSPGDTIDVVVLDFDLSWHRDSTERSVYPNVEGALGYGAPEQFDTGGTARTSLVDCFGLGMTMFYIAMGRHPRPREQESGTWRETLRSGISMQGCDEWHSLPNRYERLIFALTRSEQFNRLDFNAARLELERMTDIFSSAKKYASILAEELCARGIGVAGYEWSEDKDSATSRMSGGTIEVRGNDKTEDVALIFSWVDPGDRTRSTIQQNLEAAREYIRTRFSDLGWHVRSQVDSTGMRAEAEISTRALERVIDASAKALSQARGKFSF